MAWNRLEAFPDLLVWRVNKSEVRDIEVGLGSDREVRAERKRKREGEEEGWWSMRDTGKVGFFFWGREAKRTSGSGVILF